MNHIHPFITNPDIAIDSFKIRIPVENVEHIDKSLRGRWIALNMDTGETDPDTFRQNAFTVREDGITTRYGIEKPRGRAKEAHEFLTMGLNSKMLREVYQEGITLSTLHFLHQSILDQGQVRLSLDSLLAGHCTDVDFKQDAKVTRRVADKMFKDLERRTHVSRSMNRGCRVFRQKTNHGIQWNDRKTDSFKEAPFVKVYSKTLDLRHNSTVFTNRHLRYMDIADVYRSEFTLKNKKAFSHHGIQDTRLSTLLDMDQGELKEIRTAIVLANTESPRIRKTVQGMRNRNQERLSVLSTLLDHGLNESEILHAFTRYVEKPQVRRDIRKEVVDLYEQALSLRPSEVPKAKREQAVQDMKDVNQAEEILLGSGRVRFDEEPSETPSH